MQVTLANSTHLELKVSDKMLIVEQKDHDEALLGKVIIPLEDLKNLIEKIQSALKFFGILKT